MLEELWNGILELTARFVIPDWGSVIGLMPILVLVLLVLTLVPLFLRMARAPGARRGKTRVAPLTPEGIHMPGPSLAPIFAAVGAFFLFGGLVFGGTAAVIGLIIFALTLLYWLGEALHIYDRDIGSPAPRLPAAAPSGPPPGVHLPGPSFRPFLGALGTALLLLGLVFGGWLLAFGVFALIATLVGWLVDARKEYVKTVEADVTGHLENIPAPRTPRLLLTTFAVLLVGAIALQAGWLPPQGAAGEGGPTPSGGPGGGPGEPGEPGASGEPPPASSADVVIHALDVAFVESSFTAPADAPFTIEFVNQDDGTPHNVALHEGSPTGPEVWQGEIFPGPETMIYEVPPLPAGPYGFICTVHPNMTGTATLE